MALLVFPSGGIALITKIRMITFKQRNALQLSESFGQKRNLTDVRASGISDPLILFEKVFDAKHARVLYEMSVSISLYLVYVHRRKLREGQGDKCPPPPQIFFLIKIFFWGGGGH